MKATVGERGQVTIPKAVRDRLGLRAGQRLDVSEQDGQVVMVKVFDDDPIMAVYGTLKLPASVDEIIEEMRGPVGPPHEP